MGYELLAGRGIGTVYKVKGRHDQHAFLTDSVEASGGRLIYASPPDRAPVYLGVQLDSDERVGILVYPFRVTRRPTAGRPDDEVRGQLRYGGQKRWRDVHPVAHDVAGVDVTLILGIDLDDEIYIGLDTNLWDPLPMGISFYAKDAEVREAQRSSWHVWERVNRAGTQRSESRSPTQLETMIAFTPDRLIDYARLERRARSLRLDPALRFAAASKVGSAPSPGEVALGRHILERQFALTSEQILDIISGRNRLSVAVRGGVAEYHLEQQLQRAPGVRRVERLDIDARHDFDVTLDDGRLLRVECKNASPKLAKDGSYRVEVQKTRSSKNDPASRFYPVEGFDVVAACLFSPTGQWSFRFGATSAMARHSHFEDRLAPIQTITSSWVDSLPDLA